MNRFSPAPRIRRVNLRARLARQLRDTLPEFDVAVADIQLASWPTPPDHVDRFTELFQARWHIEQAAVELDGTAHESPTLPGFLWFVILWSALIAAIVVPKARVAPLAVAVLCAVNSLTGEVFEAVQRNRKREAATHAAHADTASTDQRLVTLAARIEAVLDQVRAIQPPVRSKAQDRILTAVSILAPATAEARARLAAQAADAPQPS